MKILVFPFGSSGDVHPMIGLSLALARRGHDVDFYACGYFQEIAERSGLNFHELGTAEAFLKAAEHPDLWNPKRAFPHLFRNGIETIMRRQGEIVGEHAGRGPVTVVASCLGFGARIACEHWKVPLITVHLQPAVIYSEIDMPKLMGPLSSTRIPVSIRRSIYRFGEWLVIDRAACPAINRLRAEFGMPPVSHLTRWWNSPDGVLCLFPEWYAKRQADWPVRSITSQFPMWDESAVQGLEPALEQFLADGPPPLVFTPGTGNRLAREFFSQAARACTSLGRRGLFLTRFPEQVPCDLPNTIQHVPYAPFSLVLPRSAAIVHHGGIGTVSQALRAGIPQLIMPLAHDQPDNAARVKRLGVGDELPPTKFTSAGIADKLTRLLSSRSVSASCQKIAARFTDQDPFRECYEMIERTVSDRLVGYA